MGSPTQKIRSLTAWPRPTTRLETNLPAVAQQDDERDEGDEDERHDREGGQDEGERRHEHDRHLGDGEDPGGLSHLLAVGLPATGDVQRDGDDRDEDDRPPRDLADEDEDALDEGKEKRNPKATVAQRASEAVAAVLDRQGAIHDLTVPSAAHPYQVGTVSQVREALLSARRAACALRRW